MVWLHLPGQATRRFSLGPFQKGLGMEEGWVVVVRLGKLRQDLGHGESGGQCEWSRRLRLHTSGQLSPWVGAALQELAVQVGEMETRSQMFLCGRSVLLTVSGGPLLSRESLKRLLIF